MSEADLLKQILSDPKLLAEISNAAFKEADTDNSGFLDKTELKSVMEKLSAENNLPKPNDNDVNEAYAQLDTNKDGKISPDEFSAFVKLVLGALAEGL